MPRKQKHNLFVQGSQVQLPEHQDAWVERFPHLELIFQWHLREKLQGLLSNIPQYCFTLTQASIVALINNSKPPSPRQQIKNNLTPSLELNPFLLTGSWGPCTLTNPHLNHQMEVVVSSWIF